MPNDPAARPEPSPLVRLLEDVAQGRAAAAGGFAAAATAGVAAAVVAQAARAARDRWPDSGGAIAQAEALRARLAALAERDAQAYGRARSLLRRAGSDRDRRGAPLAPQAAPAPGPEERERELAKAMHEAAETPMLVAEAAAEVAEVAAWVARDGSADHRADAVAAAALAEGAAAAAAALVRVNLRLEEGDDALRRAAEAEQAAARARAAAVAELT